MAGALASVLLLLNFSDGLVGAFTFIGLLATVTIVIPYGAAALASIALQRAAPPPTRSSAAHLTALIAFAVCVWVIVSSGVSTVLWGLALLAAGLPVYGHLTLAARRAALLDVRQPQGELQGLD